MLRLLLDLVAPPACAACEIPLARGGPLCGRCRRALAWLGPGACARCGAPPPCGSPCPAARAAFERAWAPVAYDGPARELVAALKFRGRTAVADVMAAQIAANAPAGLLAGVLVPAPAEPARRRARGFDQAWLLARALGRRTGLPARRHLRRASDGVRQAGAGRAARLARPIVVHARGPVPPSVVLVDDVHTTGATLDACARALRASGASEVNAVSYARVLR